jgi:hypothetical protein
VGLTILCVCKQSSGEFAEFLGRSCVPLVGTLVATSEKTGLVLGYFWLLPPTLQSSVPFGAHSGDDACLPANAPRYRRPQSLSRIRARSFRTEAGKYPGQSRAEAASLTSGLGCFPLDPRGWPRESSAFQRSPYGVRQEPDTRVTFCDTAL